MQYSPGRVGGSFNPYNALFSQKAFIAYCCVFLVAVIQINRYGFPDVGKNVIAMESSALLLQPGYQITTTNLRANVPSDAKRRQLEHPPSSPPTIKSTDGFDDYFLPRSKEVLDGIYARGKQRREQELARRGNNLTEIEPFNPWGPVYIWDWFSPDYNCPTMERIGRVGDGGKWICGVDVLKERKCVVYSYGVNKDLSFELELIGRTGCEVHAFDPTVGGVPPECKDNPHITYHKQALGPTTGPTDVFMLVESLLDSMKSNGHTFIDVLKVDIEGSEWETFKAMLPEKALPFGQLMIELHFSDTYDVFNFFENIEGHGFRIFSRETNHNPCAAGKLPIAVEFSLINPSTYFTGKPEEEAVKSIHLRPSPPKYNGVIYSLTHRANLHKLNTMLTNLEKNFNRRFQYPVVIFHEDFTEDDKSSLRNLVPHTTLEFRHVRFSIPSWLDKSKIPERTPCSPHSSTVGYRHMNRFLAGLAAEELAKEYEWQWRLDDDSLISEEIGYDVFHLMAVNNKRYGYTNIVQDDDKCVVGLWDATRAYIDQNKIQPTFFTRWNDGAVFYNNFEVSHRSVWTSTSYRNYFNYIDRLGGVYYHRWGDAPIRSIGVSLFVDEVEVHQFTDIAYTHHPFINRTATGLPSPSQRLFARDTNALSLCGVNWDAQNVSASTNGSGLCAFAAKPSAVIYTVLQGLDEFEVDHLTNMLYSLDKNFNNHHHYPVVVLAFDLTLAQRTTIRESTTSKVEFMELDFLKNAKIPDFLNHSRVKDYVDCGFGADTILHRLRNRWLAYEGMQRLAKDYDWSLRIASDALLTSNITYDPFVLLASQGKRYGYLTSMQDDSRCLDGLWESTDAYMAQEGIKPTFLPIMPEGTVFYNAFEISHRSLWESPEYRHFFDYMDRQGGMLYQRWSEQNLHTMALSLFVSPNELHRFSDVGLKHWDFINQRVDRHFTKRPLQSEWEGQPLTVLEDPDLNKLFAARRWGFQGADVATSFRLPSTASGIGSHAWLLGDTFLGTSDGHKRLEVMTSTIHNALAFTRGTKKPSPADVQFFWRSSADGTPSDAFPHPGDGIYWPVAGLSAELKKPDGSIQAKIILLVQRVVKTHDVTDFLVTDGMNFEVEGTTVIIVDNPEEPPSQWQYRLGDVPYTGSTNNWFSAIALASGKEVATELDEMVYLVGNQGTRGLGVFDKGSSNILGRIKLSALLDLKLDHIGSLTTRKVQGGSWVDTFRAGPRVPIMTPASPELTLQYSQALGRWYAMEVDTATAQLILWTAEQAYDVWKSTVIYSIPSPYDDLTKFRCYAGKGHPELGQDLGKAVELVFSYVCNVVQDSRLLYQEEHLHLYTPQFVRMTVAKPEVSTEGLLSDERRHH